MTRAPAGRVERPRELSFCVVTGNFYRDYQKSGLMVEFHLSILPYVLGQRSSCHCAPNIECGIKRGSHNCPLMPPVLEKRVANRDKRVTGGKNAANTRSVGR